ncbi:hypothetical protein RF11_15658 [Thelohanellus kitauei]|uniref:Uncharacterized protein n=1 Tax=Thelohanellus kitauei TaxID=669202 RepID=A0A0C2MRM1_THEKT|nr:hypothetical protein RF11_15658 [Thelohanellus kitauei]
MSKVKCVKKPIEVCKEVCKPQVCEVPQKVCKQVCKQQVCEIPQKVCKDVCKQQVCEIPQKVCKDVCKQQVCEIPQKVCKDVCKQQVCEVPQKVCKPKCQEVEKSCHQSSGSFSSQVQEVVICQSHSSTECITESPCVETVSCEIVPSHTDSETRTDQIEDQSISELSESEVRHSESSRQSVHRDESSESHL